eukprot:3435051-Prymnesium_polylepis.2
MSRMGIRDRTIHAMSNGSSSILVFTYKIMASGLRPEGAVPGGALHRCSLLGGGICRLDSCRISGSSCGC